MASRSRPHKRSRSSNRKGPAASVRMSAEYCCRRFLCRFVSPLSLKRFVGGYRVLRCLSPPWRCVTGSIFVLCESVSLKAEYLVLSGRSYKALYRLSAVVHNFTAFYRRCWCDCAVTRRRRRNWRDVMTSRCCSAPSQAGVPSTTYRGARVPQRFS